MRFTKGGIPLIPAGITVQPAIYRTEVAEDEVTVGNAVAVSVISPQAFGIATYAKLQNTSTAGQRIRVGIAPAFAPPTNLGLLLNPGDEAEFVNVNVQFRAIADAAGGLLSRQILTTS